MKTVISGSSEEKHICKQGNYKVINSAFQHKNDGLCALKKVI
jgi:hypothetical protein